MNEPGWARTPGNPLLFAISALGSFMTTVSQDLGFMSHPKDGTSYSTVSPSLCWGVGIDVFGQREECHLLAPPTPLPAATQCSQLVSHPSTNQAQHLLSFRASAKARYPLVWLLAVPDNPVVCLFNAHMASAVVGG